MNLIQKKKKILKITIMLIIIASILTYGVKYKKVYAATENAVITKNTTKETTKSADKISIKKLTVKIDTSKKTYTGKKLSTSVKVYKDGKKLKNNKDYVVTYKNNIKTGKATVTVKGIGNYTGTISKNFYIVPQKEKIKSVLFNAKGTKATITWKKDKMASGYAIYMSTSKNGKYKKIKTITKNSITTYTAKNLNSKKTYYFKISSYVLVKGKKIYSKSYSAIKTNTGLLAKVTLNSPMSGKDRNYNLKLASKKINGTVLKPGATFNWFKVVGSASKAKGYRKAGIFVNGKTVQGYGGGVCQVSSTLYQASLKIKLKIVERHTHSQNVPYSAVGKDVTVAYGSKNLRIKNNKKYPIKLVTYSNKTKTICEIYRITN